MDNVIPVNAPRKIAVAFDPNKFASAVLECTKIGVNKKHYDKHHPEEVLEITRQILGEFMAAFARAMQDKEQQHVILSRLIADSDLHKLCDITKYT